jgi:two-component system chemotaxis response regulator CheB
LASPDGPRFRCQIGHAFTPLGLAEAQNVELERALGVAMRTHRDRIKLFHKMRDSASTRGLVHSMARWSEAAAESEAMVAVLENAITAIRRPASEGVG